MKKVNTLIVDDDVISLRLLEIMLRKNSIVGDIIKAKNGLEAINLLERRFDINLILLDIIMPIMNGIEFLANLQAREYMAMTPVVAISTDEVLGQQAIEKGAYGFIQKPIRQDVINKLIEDMRNLIL